MALDNFGYERATNSLEVVLDRFIQQVSSENYDEDIATVIQSIPNRRSYIRSLSDDQLEGKQPFVKKRIKTDNTSKLYKLFWNENQGLTYEVSVLEKNKKRKETGFDLIPLYEPDIPF